MRILILPALAIALASVMGSCKSSAGTKTFCDTVCLKEPIRFSLEEHPYKPYVYITARDCNADTLVWSYQDMGVNRKIVLADLLETPVKLNKDFVKCYIKDTSYAWLRFNDCKNGRGYLLKIPFNKRDNIGRKSSALNSIDPKFSVAESLVAYSDRGNVFAEDMETGKSAMMTFGEKADIDYDAIHETIDSINITPSHMWVHVKLKEGWKVIEKNITLK
jgi:hypothetical protein